MENKLTQEELQQLQTAINEFESATFMVGQYTLEIENLKSQRRKYAERAESALVERERVQKLLEDKYGNGTQVNPVTGEIRRNNEQN